MNRSSVKVLRIRAVLYDKEGVKTQGAEDGKSSGGEGERTQRWREKHRRMTDAISAKTQTQRRTSTRQTDGMIILTGQNEWKRALE